MAEAHYKTITQQNNNSDARLLHFPGAMGTRDPNQTDLLLNFLITFIMGNQAISIKLDVASGKHTPRR